MFSHPYNMEQILHSVGAFNLVTHSIIIFGTLKDGKQLFQSQKCLSKWHQHFVKTLKILYSLDDTMLFKFTSMWSKHVSNNVGRDFRLPNVSISNGNIKCLIGKSIFAVKLLLKLFRATIANADIEVYSLSIHSCIFVPHASEI